MTDQVQPSLPSGGGLTVAVFVPWRQTWTLKGFSRGNLLSTIALAPQEEMTMQVSSWERRSRTLEQSSETEVSQQTDTSDTTRDTEDVFREMLSKRDFAWQLNGSLDASYSPGVASIRVSSDGGVSDTTSIQQTARNSSQSLRESTVKASSRVSSRRVTRVTQSVESGKEERVTRNIRNPNQCHTLSLDFFETLAHYEIALKFQPQRLRLVVMLPNPIKTKVFHSDLIRRNETALRNALLEPALADAFEACRYQAAYQRAQKLTAAQQQLSDTAQELPVQRNTPPATTGDPAAPQRAELERLVAAFLAAAAAIRGDSGIDEALAAIGARQPVSQPSKRRGQRWLFINFANHVFPQLLSTLDALAAVPPAPLDAAQRLLAVLPRPDSPTQLSSLNQLSDSEKEAAGLASRLKLENAQHERLFMKMDWDWAWWTGRLHEESLYTCDDNGLAGLADQLQRAWSAWESKQAQGTAMKDQEVAKVEAEGRQDKATIDDKLSMAFPLDELARASERVDTLVAHLGDHLDYYRYVLFQALPPSEQALRIVDASQGRLQVGLFEPRVVAMNGSKLVVPLTPLAGSQSLIDFVDNLRTELSESFAESEATPDTTVLPTPGVSISSRLGTCSGCEEYIEQARGHELRRLAAVASQAESEAERRRKRLAAGELDEFEERRPDLRLALESTASAPPGRP